MSKYVRVHMEEPKVRLPAWSVVLMVTLLVQSLTVTFLAGATYQKVQSIQDFLQNHEGRLEYLERKERERGAH